MESKYSRASGRWWASYLNNVDYLSPCQKVGSNFSSLVAYTFWHNKLCGTIWSASIRCLLFLGSRTPILWPACIARYEGKHMAPRGVSTIAGGTICIADCNKPRGKYLSYAPLECSWRHCALMSEVVEGDNQVKCPR